LEYDPELNSWTQKTDFGGAGRHGAVGFNIIAKGYLGTGYNGEVLKDWWQYDPELNTWTQKADFGGGPRNFAAGFSIGSKGYLGTGRDKFGDPQGDFWEYDPELNMWEYNSTGFSGRDLTVASVLAAEFSGYRKCGYHSRQRFLRILPRVENLVSPGRFCRNLLSWCYWFQHRQ
jgi:N-acetylneuraminic acid mutarotase